MLYDNPQILSENLGNNAFAWEERMEKYEKSPTLTIPSLIEGGISDVQIGSEIVFEEMENGRLRSCVGLKNFVHIRKASSDENSKLGIQENSPLIKGDVTEGQGDLVSEKIPPTPFLKGDTKTETSPFGHKNMELLSERDSPSENDKKGKQPLITIFDNHNHALYFWIDAVKKGILQPGFTLIHIDEHSDLWKNSNKLDLSKALGDEQYAWDFTNLSCNVGNYIQPARESGLVKEIIRIENESQMDEYMNYAPTENTVLNLDLDIFAPELDFIPEEKKIRIIQNLLRQVDYVTIATSPFFIDQGTAIEKLQNIMKI